MVVVVLQSSMVHTLIWVFVVELVLVLESTRSYSVDSPILRIEDGVIRGKQETTVRLHKPYSSFRGIPYAKPPLGPLRFERPVKNSKWPGILDATRDRDQCVQGFDPVQGREDCLYINVYTPSLREKNLPVLVWIYGGAFIIGNSSYSNYGPDYLLEDGVVFVQFNYRTGAFGFLSTQDTICPGNNGLRDQLLALQWVQTNIRAFGGDPEKVTIYGQSAGAASVAYLVQSKLGKGLFRAAMMSSGTSLCGWALNRKSLKTAVAIAKTLNVSTTNSQTLVDGLRKIDAVKLQKTDFEMSTQIMMEDPLEGVQFGPVIEPKHEDAVVTKESIDVMASGEFNQVPILMGINSNEGSAPGRIPGLFVDFVMEDAIIIPDYAPSDLTENKTKEFEAGGTIKNFYFGLRSPSEEPPKAVQFISDSQWNYPVRRAVINQSKYVPVYFYGFWYEGELGGILKRKFPGVGHSEDLGYIFRSDVKSNSSHDYLVGRRMVRMITNFAKYRNPTPQKDELLQDIIWPLSSSNPGNLVMMKIGYNLEVTMNPFNKDMRFYDEIYQTYGNPPY